MEQSLFSKSETARQESKDGARSVIEAANDLERRLKILEDRYSTLRKKTQTTDENLLAIERKFSKEFKLALADILTLKRDIAGVQEKLAQFSSELAVTAKRPEFRALEAYVSFFEPMQFVTRQDLKNALFTIKKPE